MTEAAAGPAIREMGSALQGFASRRRKAGVVLAATAGALLLSPAGASADLIYADPAGSAFFCSEAQPCKIGIAINLAAQDNDEVVRAPRAHTASSTLEVPGGIERVTIRPRDPGTRPIIASTASPALQLTGSGATVQGIELQHDNPGAPGLFALAATRIKNVIATSNGDTPCQLGAGSRLIDTICHATALTGRGLWQGLVPDRAGNGHGRIRIDGGGAVVGGGEAHGRGPGPAGLRLDVDGVPLDDRGGDVEDPSPSQQPSPARPSSASSTRAASSRASRHSS